jgi:CHAT domain-containing protein/tetratricopeptide (TPR) repeat protein
MPEFAHSRRPGYEPRCLRLLALGGLLALASFVPSGPALAARRPVAPPAARDFRAADSLARLVLPGLCARWSPDSLSVQPSLDAALDELAPHRPVVADSLLGCALRSRELHRARDGEASPRAIRADVRVALLLDGAERWREARALLLDRWAAIARLGGGDPVLLSDALYVLGRAEHYLESGSLLRSDSALAASIELRVRALGASDPRTGLAYEWRGRTLVRQLLFDEAERSFTRADPGLVRLHGRVLEQAEYEVWRGNYLFQQEEHERARRHYLRAREIRQAGLPPDHPDLARAIGLVANVEYRLGRLDTAQSLYRQADAILTARDPVSRVALVNRSNLASLLLALGDPGEALGLLEGVYAERARLLPNHIQIAGAVMNLATAHFMLGRHAEALRYCVVADSSFQRQGDRSNRIRAYTTWAEFLAVSGRTREARERHRLAVEIAEELNDAGDPRLATALDGAGAFHLGMGELAEARRFLERANAVSDSAFGPDHPLGLQRRLNLARLERAQGHPRRAAEIALEVEHRSTGLARLVIGALSEREALAYAASRPTGLPLLFEMARRGEIADSTWRTRLWEAWIPSRALVLDAVAERARALRLAEADTLVRRVEEARSHYAGVLVRAQLDRRNAVDGGELDRARRAFEEAVRRSAERIPARPAAPITPTAAELAARLPAGSALAALVAAEPDAIPRRMTTPNVTRSTDGSYLAFVVRAGQPTPELVVLGGVARIDALFAAWYERARRSPAGLLGARRTRFEGETRQRGEALRAAVLDPVRARTGGARTLFWVPDGALHLLNPVALPSRRGDRYVVEEDLLVHLLTTERELLHEAPPAPPTRRLLAVGGVEFDASRPDGQARWAQSSPLRGGNGPEARPPDPVTFRALPSSSGEVRDVAALWSELSRNGHAPEITVLAGTEASEAALRDHCAAKDVVHIATHGIVAGEDGGLTGLALAGVEQRAEARSGGDDGVLTAQELAGLDLDQADWLVLSGCETGRGTAVAGEGIFGLRRAGQVAGARIVIASLWPVQDTSTRLWMRELYAAHHLAGRSTAEAARDASRELLARSRHARLSTHPSGWAGFVAVGR